MAKVRRDRVGTRLREPRIGSGIDVAMWVRVALAAAGIATALPFPVFAQEYHVDTDADNRVAFISRAPIDEFEGTTDRIDGYVVLDGGGVRAGASFEGATLYFEVDLASLDTGIGLRNRHMRDNYLEVDDFPFATFSGAIDRISADADAFRVVSDGRFVVHGVERPRTVDCGLRPDGGGWWVDCSFVVQLTDHDIEIPKVMFLKLAEDIRVELSFRLRPAPAAGEEP